MVVSKESIIYPDSDGRPMSDNTEQFRWIVYIKEGLEWLFADLPDVFVAGDLLWYPIEGANKLRQAPDVLVAFGRPKGRRGSYKQWLEDNIPPQVVFEVLSPGNTLPEMTRKFQFYERYGVEEYYLYDPDRQILDGFVRRGDNLEGLDTVQDWLSPRLGIRLGLRPTGELEIRRPDGVAFESYEDLARRAQQAERRAELLAERLRALGIDPEEVR
ncbi:Uma2 family endonuclease [Gloeobacter kilaueensis]|uniref:Putative restriction endonuclease domain-containing protein n=1 Tax=Gloeobacter kilaueensis (strain ATCC BAA-2537 / CCAP 1431/1 / ULC 316 / JS1) TaxID=1183438 RepID=U5QLY5_GLOK1|nr:Uma2 family endonuclease [Gloeobacter kilaueensis]AGY59873.1 hypothetical protein GKIL_3627 [Gloeobacter kilaueensis JS1]